MRLRIVFAKTAAMRYTGHLDLHKAWERALRRAGLPLAYSQGFHPQPRINLAAALPLGFTSECEVADVWLEADLPLAQIEATLSRALPPGIALRGLTEVEARLPALQTQVQSAEYEALLLEAPPDLDQRLAGILAAETLPRQRRDKPYDLRPLIEHLERSPQRLPGDEAGQARVRMRLAAREAATGRPEAVLEELGLPPEAARVARTRLIFIA